MFELGSLICEDGAVLNTDNKSATAPGESRWADRIDRAVVLTSRYPEPAALLQFYAKVLAFQQQLAGTASTRFDSNEPFREQIDLALARKHFPFLLELSVGSGPAQLAARAQALQQTGNEEQARLLKSGILSPSFAVDEAVSFFARACLQPLAENLQLQIPTDPNYFGNTCPACGAYPQLAILHPEGEGGRRWLLCSFCLREWLFRRVICPWCGEEDKQKLPTYSAESCCHVRVQACESCQGYLKAVDMTVDGHAIPLIDEAAMAVLDVWAVEHGYRKITRNLLGF